ncbi:MAG: trehalose-phosphatase [Sphingopyxis sp.]|uniref:trehalose-phosphatase n=1 Tax=Sphingopyxis sp. TaxID=1908224 RepID=UPI003D80B1C7
MHKNPDLPPPPPLSELAALHPVALFLDFDGTLVDIAETPGGIAVPGDLAARLDALGSQLGGRVALVSGRARADIHRHLGTLAIMTIGSHGAEFGAAAAAPIALSQHAIDAIAALAARWPGLLVETKPHGVAIHYRQEPDAASAVLTCMDDIAARERLAVRRGKMVVELGPEQANKGRAVARLMAQPRYAGALPVFIGDDVTDEDGFTQVAAAGGHGILVGPPRTTTAHFRLRDPEEVHQWLTL